MIVACPGCRLPRYDRSTGRCPCGYTRLGDVTFTKPESFYCPCGGRCHTDRNPCSLGCLVHDGIR